MQTKSAPESVDVIPFDAQESADAIGRKKLPVYCRVAPLKNAIVIGRLEELAPNVTENLKQ